MSLETKAGAFKDWSPLRTAQSIVPRSLRDFEECARWANSSAIFELCNKWVHILFSFQTPMEHTLASSIWASIYTVGNFRLRNLFGAVLSKGWPLSFRTVCKTSLKRACGSISMWTLFILVKRISALFHLFQLDHRYWRMKKTGWDSLQNPVPNLSWNWWFHCPQFLECGQMVPWFVWKHTTKLDGSLANHFEGRQVCARLGTNKWLQNKHKAFIARQVIAPEGRYTSTSNRYCGVLHPNARLVDIGSIFPGVSMVLAMILNGCWNTLD